VRACWNTSLTDEKRTILLVAGWTIFFENPTKKNETKTFQEEERGARDIFRVCGLKLGSGGKAF